MNDKLKINMKMQNKLGLKEIGNRNPFTVPENYFEDFAQQMKQITVTPKINARFGLATWMYVAATVMGIFVLVNFFYKIHQDNLLNNENYDLYVMSQTDDMAIADYYLTTEDTETEQGNK